MTTHPYDDIEAFAMGGLDEGASRQVLAHADQCPTCAVLLAQAMRTVDTLEAPIPRPLIGAGIRSDVPRRVTPFLRAVRLWRAIAVATAAAACLLALWSVNAVRLARLNVPVAPVVPVASLVHSHFLHHSFRRLRGTAGSAKIIVALDGSWVYLVGDGFTPHTRYQLWEVNGDEARNIGIGTTDASGQVIGFWTQPPHRVGSFTLNVNGSNPFMWGPQLRWP